MVQQSMTAMFPELSELVAKDEFGNNCTSARDVFGENSKKHEQNESVLPVVTELVDMY